MEDGNPMLKQNDRPYLEFLYAQSDSSDHSTKQMLSPAISPFCVRYAKTRMTSVSTNVNDAKHSLLFGCVKKLRPIIPISKFLLMKQHSVSCKDTNHDQFRIHRKNSISGFLREEVKYTSKQGDHKGMGHQL